MEFTHAYLRGLIDGQIEESAHLEYKAGPSLDRKDPKKKSEMMKDVSAFANASGGFLIYGISEFHDPERKHLPEKFDPVDQSAYSKEWLDQMLGQIQPRIEGLKIHPIHVGPAAQDYCYVVEISQSGTAHQATDLKYYRRRNFENTAMEDYEIREAMNRRKDPVVVAEVRVLIAEEEVFSRNRPTQQLSVRVRNVGHVLARNYVIVTVMPLFMRGHYVKFSDEFPVVEINGKSGWELRLNSAALHPLFPGDEHILRKTFTLHPNVSVSGELPPSMSDIHLTVFADNAPKTSEWKPLKTAQKDWV